MARPPIVLLDNDGVFDDGVFDEPETTTPERRGSRRPIRVRLETPTDEEVRRFVGRGRTY